MARPKKRVSPVQVPHLTDAVERGCPLPASHGRLDEVHYFWHKTAETYDDPDTFRFNLNALIQAARNVTFALQSEKAMVPRFSEWYADWQARMRADEVLRWVHDARNTVVKRGDLEGRSVAKVSVIVSYAEPPALEVAIPPSTTLEELVAIAAIQALPRELKESAILVVERKWISEQLPSHEALEALAYTYGFLFRIVADAHEQCGSKMVAGSNRPSDYRLPCMVANELLRSRHVNLRTGAILTPAQLAIREDAEAGEEAALRYGIETQLSPTDDHFARAEKLLEIAKKVLARDKTHIFLVQLHHPEGRWQYQVLAPEDSEDKLLLWRRIASDVEAYGFDAYICISEAWSRPLADDSPAADKDKRSRKRGESLMVTVETANGKVRHWIVPFERREGEILFGETCIVENRPFFSEPVRQAWTRIFKDKN